jgi:hypothetical protein
VSIKDERRVRILAWSAYRQQRKLGDSPEQARKVLAPIFKALGDR